MPDPTPLPIRRITFHEHGLALLEREGRVDGDMLAIELRAEDLDDALKSLVIRDRARDGALVSADCEITEDPRGSGDAIALSVGAGMLDLIDRLTGWQVCVELVGSAAPIEGRVAGLQYAKERRRLRGATLMVFDGDSGAMRLLPAELISKIIPIERPIDEDLRCFLDAGRRAGSARIALRLPAGVHDLRVSYLIKAAAWRVSYRVVAQGGSLLLQAWAKIDKRFDEALERVEMMLASPAAERDGSVRKALEPVTLRRGASALVPILSATLECRRELLFNADEHVDHPVAAWRCTNTTGQPLAPGPVALFDGDRYRGEAVLPATGSDRCLYLPYAVEPGIDVGVERDFVSQAHDLRIAAGTLVQQSVEIRTYRYRIGNRGDAARALTIECAADALPGELFDSPAPASHANGALRWEVLCPAQGVAMLELRTRRPIERRHALADLQPQRLEVLLKTPRLAPATRRVLELLRSELARIDENEQQGVMLDEQRRRVLARQEHLRRNIRALASMGDEGEIRLRMARELQDTESALSGIEQLLGELASDSEVRRKALVSKLPGTAGQAEHSLH
ncbi:MAG TPA: hypothetical protein PK177_14570 [Burkholderiaceae bacterium]|nr:hypothetical protein [Burkholderiaceae bacterium]